MTLSGCNRARMVMPETVVQASCGTILLVHVGENFPPGIREDRVVQGNHGLEAGARSLPPGAPPWFRAGDRECPG